MNRLQLIFAAVLLAALQGAVAQTVMKGVEVYSQSMKRPVRNMIVLPENYDSVTPLPVAYLLHGFGDNGEVWLRIRPDLPQLANRFGMILVCPDGDNSWYFDSPVNPAVRFETYLSSELPAFVDSCFATIASPDGRFITGLSMGGHGALYNAMRHQDVFGACGSMSGGVDFTPFPERWQISRSLGSFESCKEVWKTNTVMAQVPLVKPGLAIIIDCGQSDFFLEVNENLHRELLKRGIAHDYSTRPGAHNFAFWHDSLPLHLTFFTGR